MSDTSGLLPGEDINAWIEPGKRVKWSRRAPDDLVVSYEGTILGFARSGRVRVRLDSGRVANVGAHRLTELEP